MTVAPRYRTLAAADPLSELPEPVQSDVRRMLVSPMPTTMDPIAYAAGFDGMAWMAAGLGYRAAAARLHEVASFIRARATGAAHE